MSEHRERFGEARELIEHRTEVCGYLGARTVFAEEPCCFLEVTLRQPFDAADRADELPLLRLFGDCEQCVRRARQSGHDDERSARDSTANDVRRAFDGCRVADGRATELDDDHAPETTPVAMSNSA